MKIVLAVLAAVALAVSAAAPSAADAVVTAPTAVPTVAGPAQTGHGAAAAYAKGNLAAAPPGANDFACKPTALKPRPVVLLHGNDASAYSDMARLSPTLVAAGFCTFALNYGGKPGEQTYGTQDIPASAAAVAEFVDRVLSATGAAKADVLGYSTGATVSRYYVNRLGGAAKVEHWIGLASPSYGGVMYGVVPVVQAIPGGVDAAGLAVPPAVVQQMQGSAFMIALNRGGDTVPGVRYTTIGTRFDEMIQPVANMALRGRGATNIIVQDLCPINQTGHFNMIYDPFTLQLVVNALDPSTASTPHCEFVALGTGIPEVVMSAHS